ncbi:MAG: hypothetical protein K5860_05435 [Bacteroidales bacterium]|nr:hypothetical protein [Bacteroidales bacterium]
MIVEHIKYLSKVFKTFFAGIFAQAKSTNHSNPHTTFGVHIFRSLFRRHRNVI